MTLRLAFRIFLPGFVLFFLSLVAPHHLLGEWNLETIGSGNYGKVAVDPAGRIHVCYLSEPMQGEVIYAVHANDQWSKETLTNSGQIFQVALATDTDGAVHIIYAEADWYHGTFTLRYINNRGNGWSSPETLASNDKGFWSLSIGIDGDNHVHISYLKASSMASSSSIYYLTNKSGIWESYTLNDEYQNPAYDHIAMAVAPDGYVYFASYFFRVGGPGYLTNAPNGQWFGPQLIQSNWSGGQMEGMIIDIALDPNNNPHVSYVGSDNGESLESHRYATITGPNKLWTSQQIDDGSWFSAGHAIASDPDGVIHIAYIHYATGELRYTMNYSGSWPHETVDTPGAEFNRNVDMVTDQDGFVHIIYEDNENVLYATNRVEIPAPNIVLSPPELSFGTVDTGQVLTKLLQVKNEGVLDLHISDIKLTGGDSAEFSLDHLCDTIIPDDSCAVQVTFNPEVMGEKQTTLEITSDDPDTPVIRATITGRTPYPVISVDPDALEFDPAEVGESDTLTLTIENIGDADLTIDSLRITGDEAGAFSYSSFCWTITQKTGCDLEVIFNPAEVGTHTATLRIYSNDPEQPEVTVSLQGRTPSARIEIQSDVLDFGTIPVHNLATRQLSIKNTGQRTLTITSATISGADAPLFHTTNTCNTVGPGTSCDVEITFRPQSTGPKSAQLLIASNDPEHPVYYLTLQGAGGENLSLAYTYGTGEKDRFFCMDTLSSGDYILGGHSGTHGYLTKISPEGAILWQKEYTSGSSGDAIYTVREMWDHGFVVAGTNANRYRWIARLDENGAILWQKQAEEDYWGKVRDVVVTSDSCLIAVGETWPQGPADPDMWVGKFDYSGTLLWQKRVGKKYVGTLETNFERGFAILETAGGNFIVAGGGGTDVTPTYALQNHPDGGFVYAGSGGILWKFSAEGDIIWQKKLDAYADESDFWLAHLSPSGTVLWQYAYPQSNFLEWIYDITFTGAGDIIALGSVQQLGNNDMRVMRLTKTGSVVWQKKFQAPGDQEGFDIQVHSGGSVAIAGYYEMEAPESDGWFCQLTPDGSLEGCASEYMVNTLASAESGSATLENITLPYTTTPGAFADASCTASEGTATAQNLCTGIPVDIDFDGVDDVEEAGPDGQDTNYDGNNDGLPDAQQDNVASLHSNDGAHYLTIETNPGVQLRDVAAKDNPSPADQPEAFEFPLGFFSFTLTGIDTGATTVVDFLLPEGSAPLTYYKYAPTADNAAPHWYEFLYDGTTGADIAENQISLHFTDGLLGDEDLTENASITDIGGPGMFAASLTAPTLRQPENGSVGVSVQPVFVWEEEDSTNWCQFQLSSDPQFSNLILESKVQYTPLLTRGFQIKLKTNTTYYWKMRTVSETDTSAWSEVWSFTTQVPGEYALHQNYPNPFDSETTIEFSLPEANRVRIVLYDLRGNLCEVLTDQSYEAGDHKIVWTPKFYSNGIYFCRMKAGTFSDTKRLVILK